MGKTWVFDDDGNMVGELQDLMDLYFDSAAEKKEELLRDVIQKTFNMYVEGYSTPSPQLIGYCTVVVRKLDNKQVLKNMLKPLSDIYNTDNISDGIWELGQE